MRNARSATGLVAGLLLLSFLPLLFGVLRLIQLASGAGVMPVDPRFTASPLPVIVHIVSGGLYAVLGALQFPTAIRLRWPRWHRVAGWVLVLCGLLAALSALWMTLFYPRQTGTGELLYLLRLLFGSVMVASFPLGIAAVIRGDVKVHRAWLVRGYAIGLGAGTQMLTLMVGEMIAGPPSELAHALLMGAGWVINLTVAEWSLRRRRAR